MSRKLLYLLLISIGINVFVFFKYVDLHEADSTPHWKPFEINSNVTLESLVQDGYRCVSMDCGYVYFGKSIGDTIISYYII
jgi:hypothetical protein